MADDREKPELANSQPEPSPVALALGGASRDEADALLKKQRELVQLQIDDLKREDRLRHWSLLIHHVSDVMKVVFELSLAFVGLAFATFIAAALWTAAHDHGLVIEAFQVPNDMADRGLTGQVVASRLLDKLSAMQNATKMSAPAQAYAGSWSNDIKIQIPQTGMSIGEFNRDLRAWLGYETHISGEVFRDGDNIYVTARIGGEDGATFSGKPGELDALMQKAAEQIYRKTQPYRYAQFIVRDIDQTDDKVWEEARTVLLDLARSSDPNDRAWALVGLAQIARFHDKDTASTQTDLKEALELVPDHPLALSVSCNRGMQIAHEEEALAYCRAASKKLSGGASGLSPRLTIAYRFEADANIALLTGDYDAVRKVSKIAVGYFGTNTVGAEDSNENLFISFAAQHDRRAMRDTIKSIPPIATLDPQSRADRLWAVFYADMFLGDWRAVVASAPEVARVALSAYPGSDNDTLLAAQNSPWIALARAELGDFAGAASVIDRTSPECTSCLRVRGDIAALARHWDAAEHWFELAAKLAPSIPSVYTDWGQMLLTKGDADGAIAKFTLANQKGPHFADPLEMWGEALMAKNCSDLALAKFAQAAKYAPNWGRLHLKWGEALLWSGNRDESKKQFDIAAALDLTASEKSELVRMDITHG